ncbi:MAG TPA: 4Fe-4S binding protein [Methylophilaceae bacterium]|nr:4Fe-4S binding protein [Methylophilaceae bacterium]HQR60322.1 4Fe-4S binding protein [Methylophilaceae bacterium]
MSPPVQSVLAAIAAYPAPKPVPVVEYRSAGHVLVIGDTPQALAVARDLADKLTVSLLLTKPAGATTGTSLPIFYGEIEIITGWLGEFTATWTGGSGNFDLVLNLTANRYFTMHQPPQGYFAPADVATLQQATAEILDAVGEFEKPKFFLYQEKTCAHSRSRLPGCDRCIEVCSTEAISAQGEHIRVEPHLCMGCGACATVCPSGAMQYNFPSVSYWGGKLQAALAAYRTAGGTDACLLLHNPGDGAALVQASALPANVIPLEIFHVASIGLDWLLGALALGAGRVVILAAGSEAPQYLTALHTQMALGSKILQELGYGEGHFSLIETADAAALQQALAEEALGSVPQQRAAFRLFDDKRTTLEFCIEHFANHAPTSVPEALALPTGAPFGAVEINGAACTLCLSCVSVCPAAALQDGAGAPQLKFIERNCVQCGLCESACPEDAIHLQPRLLLTPAAKQARVLHEDRPFPCVRCGKPFATTHMVGAILHKLAGHSMFATPEARRRLQMCGDCRVKDTMEAGETMAVK